MRTVWRDGDRIREVELTSLGPGHWRVRVDDAEFEVRSEATADGRLRLTDETGGTTAEVTAAGSRRFVRLGALDFVLDRESAGRRRGAGGHGGGLEAPMPGVVTKVLVAVGDAVEKGQPLVAIEAMKMEHMLTAPPDGTIERLHVTEGAQVAEAVALVDFKAD